MTFSLGMQPLANDFKTENEEHEGLAPLEIMVCSVCGLAQLSVVVNPMLIYSKNYPYVTSKSDTMLQHFKLLLDAIKSESPARTILEIGSNDGSFLKFCESNGVKAVAGIDPAENLAESANSSGISTLLGLFDKSNAEAAKWTLVDIDVIVARHVFGHVDDWGEFVKNLEIASSPETLIVLEVPYVLDFLEKCEFDTTYHEHLSYVSVKAIAALLKNSNFRIDKIIRFTIHGGAIAIMLRRKDFPHPIHHSVQEFLNQENTSMDEWKSFSRSANDKISDLKKLVEKLVSEGKSVCGFGASAKSTVIIQACGFIKEHISFICDSTPNKQGKLSPANDIPIVSEDWLLKEQPDYAVIFCWNFRDEVIKKNQEYLNQGGHFIIPIPTLEII